MKARKVLIRFETGSRPWRIYWGDTLTLADTRKYRTIEEAGAAAQALLGGTRSSRPRRSLKLVAKPAKVRAERAG